MSLRDPNRTFVSFYPNNAAQTFGLFVEAGWDLQARCWRCGKRTNFPGADLVERYGAHRTVGWLYPQLVCSDCKVGFAQVWTLEALTPPAR
jgi:hypothetical protein